MKNLTTLNISNNCIYDYASYRDINGNSITYNTLSVLEELHKNHKLNRLYMNGNTGITNWTILSDYTDWAEHSGW